MAEFHTELELISPEVRHLLGLLLGSCAAAWSLGLMARAGAARSPHLPLAAAMRACDAQVQALPQVAHVLQLERWLMEGAYNKVLASSKASMASDLHAQLIGQLATTVRWVARGCAEFALLAASWWVARVCSKCGG